MTDNEIPSSAEFASEAELENLFQKTSAWLIAHGVYEDPTPGITPTMVEGLPVREVGEIFQIRVPGDNVRALLPAAALRLEIGEEIEFTHTLAYISQEPGEVLERRDPSLSVYIQKAISSVSREELLWVSQESDEWQSNRMRVPRLGSSPPTGEEAPSDADDPNNIQRFIENVQAEREFGVNQLTRGECQDIEEIVDNLDRLATD